MLFLDFEGFVPKEVTAQRWPAGTQRVDDWSLPDGEEITVRQEDGWRLYPAGTGDFVYTVQAKWDKLWKAEYVFWGEDAPADPE